MKEKHPPLYLLTGIILGVLTGLLIAYVILPVQYADNQPSTLSSAQKEVYRALVGRAYLYEADSGRAFSRLALLQDSDLSSVLQAQSQQMLAASADVESARGLALLAAAANHAGQVITPLVPIPTAIETTVSPTSTATNTATLVPTMTITPTGIPATSTRVITVLVVTSTPTQLTSTPFATFTPRPSATPQPTEGAPYELTGQKEVCDDGVSAALLMVEVEDAAGNGVPGVMIEITLGNGGTTDFYTGLYPEIDSGYADYSMSAGSTYSIRVGSGGNPVKGLSIPQCTTAAGKSYEGGLKLTFKQ